MNRASTRRHWKPAILAIGVLAAIVAIVVGLSGGNGRANAQDNDPHQNGVGCDDKLFATSSPPFGGHDVPVGPCKTEEENGSQTATASPSVTETTTATATAT